MCMHMCMHMKHMHMCHVRRPTVALCQAPRTCYTLEPFNLAVERDLFISCSVERDIPRYGFTIECVAANDTRAKAIIAFARVEILKVNH